MADDSSSASGGEETPPVTPGEDVAGPTSGRGIELRFLHGPQGLEVTLRSYRSRPRRRDFVAGHQDQDRPRERSGQEHPRSSWWPGQAHKTPPEAFSALPVSAVMPTLADPEAAVVSPGPADASGTFWSTLSPEEQRQFRSRAQKREYEPGARLMREGDTGDHVMVVLTGHTEICVDDHGTDRVIARRGPGELIGERAALQEAERSATVIALNTVRVLVMQTEDFAYFLGVHPRIVGVVENQVYFRLTEEPPRPGPGGNTSDVGDSDPSDEGASFGHTGLASFTGQNCTVIFIDVVGFSAPGRDDSDRLRIRRQLTQMTSAALKAVWNECYWDDRGDGFLVVVPSRYPTSTVLEYLLVALPIALKRYNERCEPSCRFQLRAALDVGAVVSDDTGVAGQVIINASRLLEAPALKKAMAGSDAPLGLCVSDFVYQNTVRHARYVTDPDAYSKIRCRIKESSLQAWMTLVSSPLQVPPRRRPLLAVG